MNRQTVLTAVVLAGLVGLFFSSIYVHPHGWHPCHDDFDADHPQASMGFAAEQSGEGVVVTHVGGETFTSSNVTTSLTIRIADSETENVASVVWLNETIGSRVEPGDEVTVHQTSLENMTLSTDDEISVIWRGKPDDVPKLCPTYDLESVVIDQDTVES